MELQAVIMAGGYSDGTKDLSYPKPLLPIGKRKLIWYPVNWLMKAGFDSVVIMSLESMRFDIKEAISDIDIQMKFVSVPDRDNFSTLESICLLEKEIKTDLDLLIVNCDLITNVKLHKFVDIHRLHDSSLTVMLSENKSTIPIDNLPGTKSMHKDQERDWDIIGMTELPGMGKRIVFAHDEFDLPDENVMVKRKLSHKFPKMEIRIDLEDIHLYIISNWLLKYIFQLRPEGSFRRFFLPLVISKQFVDDNDNKPRPLNESSDEQYDDGYNKVEVEDNSDIHWHARKNVERRSGTFANLLHRQQQRKQKVELITCNAYVNQNVAASAKSEKGDGDSEENALTLCVNNVARFVEANRLFFRQDFSFLYDMEENSPRVHASCQVAAKTTITKESMLEAGCEVGEKTVIKRSMIGKNCIIAANCKISNCIIMDNVTIASGCVLQGTVICSNASIQEKSEIKDSFIASNKVVKSASKLTRESLADGNVLEI